MSDSRIVLAVNPDGRLTGIGPFKSNRKLSECREEIRLKDGWAYEATVPLVGGADLKHLEPGEAADGHRN